MPTLRGTYTAKRDGQTYGYEVTWQAGSAHVAWQAKVRLGDTIVALPSGSVPAAAGVAEAVRRDVETAIEQRISME